MKQTVKTSRAAGQLEKMFRELNKHYFAGKLPEPIISLKKTPSAYGHITCSKVWQAGGENKYEINISSATLDRPIEETASTLLHEMVHEYCMETGIKDTSNNGVYHNRRFKEQAEAHGLTDDHHEKYGWTITSPSEELLDFIIFQGWQDIQMGERLAWADMAGTGAGSTSPGSSQTGAPKPPKANDDRPGLAETLYLFGRIVPLLQIALIDQIVEPCAPHLEQVVDIAGRTARVLLLLHQVPDVAGADVFQLSDLLQLQIFQQKTGRSLIIAQGAFSQMAAFTIVDKFIAEIFQTHKKTPFPSWRTTKERVKNC